MFMFMLVKMKSDSQLPSRLDFRTAMGRNVVRRLGGVI